MKTRTIVNTVGIGALCISAYLCTDKLATEASERRQTLWSGQDRNRATNFLKDITYVKDPRTGTCFALYQVRISGLDREFATAVPCDGIPTNMLVIPDMGTNTNTIAK